MEWDTWVRFLLRFTVDMFFMKMGLKAWEMEWEETEMSKVERSTCVILWSTWKRLRTEESWNYLAFIKALGQIHGFGLWFWMIIAFQITAVWFCNNFEREREWIAYLALYCCSLQGVVAVVCLCALMTWSLLGNNVHLVEVLWKERFFVKNTGEKTFYNVI